MGINLNDQSQEGASITNRKDGMNIRIAQQDDIDILFEIRTSVVENHQSREEIAELGITPESVAKMLETDCCAWIAEISDRPIGFSIVNATEKRYLAYSSSPLLNAEELDVP